MPIFKKTKCKMKWCYSPLRHEDGTCDRFCTYNTVRMQTNADLIKTMSNEELAKFFANHATCESCLAVRDKCGYDNGCYEAWFEWLKKESE